MSKAGEPPYFSMQFVEGENLAQSAAALKGKYPAMARILVRVARAVEYAHQHGILHRDLKPANVLLDRAGSPFVVDFGLAKRIREDGAESTAEQGIAGTVPYMAPEQTIAKGRLTTAVDVYGLGAILYQLLTGRPPFQGKDDIDVIHQVRHDEPVRPRALKRKLPRDLESICLKCLHKIPDKRYASTAAAADDLERFLAGRPTRARPVSSAERILKWVKRRPAIAALTAAVFLSAMVGLGAFSYQSWQRGVALEDAEYKRYVQLIGRAADYLDNGQADHAEFRLQQCPPQFRDWECAALATSAGRPSR